jgi:hypothetical protein
MFVTLAIAWPLSEQRWPMVARSRPVCRQKYYGTFTYVLMLELFLEYAAKIYGPSEEQRNEK